MFSGDAQARLPSGVGFTAALLAGPCGLLPVAMQAVGTARDKTLRRSSTPRPALRLARMLVRLRSMTGGLRGWSVTWPRLGFSSQKKTRCGVQGRPGKTLFRNSDYEHDA